MAIKIKQKNTAKIFLTRGKQKQHIIVVVLKLTVVATTSHEQGSVYTIKFMNVHFQINSFVLFTVSIYIYISPEVKQPRL